MNMWDDKKGYIAVLQRNPLSQEDIENLSIFSRNEDVHMNMWDDKKGFK